MKRINHYYKDTFTTSHKFTNSDRKVLLINRYETPRMKIDVLKNGNNFDK